MSLIDHDGPDATQCHAVVARSVLSVLGADQVIVLFRLPDGRTGFASAGSQYHEQKARRAYAAAYPMDGE